MNAIDLADVVKSDLMYLDPPYNGRQYMSNYHLLERIAKYDYPVIKGITGMRLDSEKMSDFCKKSKVEAAFKNLLGSLNCKYILLSYNNEGLLSTEEMKQIVCDASDLQTFYAKTSSITISCYFSFNSEWKGNSSHFCW